MLELIAGAIEDRSARGIAAAVSRLVTSGRLAARGPAADRTGGGPAARHQPDHGQRGPASRALPGPSDPGRSGTFVAERSCPRGNDWRYARRTAGAGCRGGPGPVDRRPRLRSAARSRPGRCAGSGTPADHELPRRAGPAAPRSRPARAVAVPAPATDHGGRCPGRPRPDRPPRRSAPGPTCWRKIPPSPPSSTCCRPSAPPWSASRSTPRVNPPALAAALTEILSRPPFPAAPGAQPDRREQRPRPAGELPRRCVYRTRVTLSWSRTIARRHATPLRLYRRPVA